MEKHLPGPWRVVVYPGDERGVRVFEILAPDDSSLSWEHEVLRATRTLIEAAPDAYQANLLSIAALENVWATLMGGRHPDMERLGGALAANRAAIAKAEGRAP